MPSLSGVLKANSYKFHLEKDYSPSSTSPGSTTACTCSDSAYAQRAYAGSIVQKATRMYLVRVTVIRLRVRARVRVKGEGEG